MDRVLETHIKDNLNSSPAATTHPEYTKRKVNGFGTRNHRKITFLDTEGVFNNLTIQGSVLFACIM